MKGSIAMSWIAGVALSLIAAPLTAQTTVEGAVIIRSGPRDGQVARRAATVIRTDRNVIVVKRLAPRRVGWWKKHGYRVVTVYHDGHRYYLRRFAWPNLRPVIVYERGGRYYIGEDHAKRKHRQYDHHDNRYRDHD